MEIEKIKVGNGIVLSEAGNLFPEDSFRELVDTIKLCYSAMEIAPENMRIEYQRFSNANSILAIKLMEGSNYDKENYMFVGASAHKYSDKINCNVFMHADAKCSQQAMKMSSMISGKIVGFFEQTEQDLSENGMADIEFSVIMPLSEEKLEEKPTKKEPRYKKLLKIFGRK